MEQTAHKDDSLVLFNFFSLGLPKSGEFLIFWIKIFLSFMSKFQLLSWESQRGHGSKRNTSHNFSVKIPLKMQIIFTFNSSFKANTTKLYFFVILYNLYPLVALYYNNMLKQ